VLVRFNHAARFIFAITAFALACLIRRGDTMLPVERVEGFMVVVRFAAVANVRGSGETWRRSRKLPCRTNTDGQLSSCQ